MVDPAVHDVWLTSHRKVFNNRALLYTWLTPYIHIFSLVVHLVSAAAKECCHDNPRWAHLGPRVYVHVRMRCTWMRACMVRGELHAGAGRAIAGVDGYMAWLTASQIEHSTYAGHPAYSRYYCRQPWLKGVS